MATMENKDYNMVEEKSLQEFEKVPPNPPITADPHDPLTWSTPRKLLITITVGLWLFIGTFNMIMVGPALEIIPVDLGSSFSTSTYLVGGPLLAYGVASFFWVPFGNRYGVRLTFVLSAIAAGCMDAWGAKATTFGSLVAARTLASAFYASPETLAPQMVGDLFYLKDRGKAITFFLILQGSGYSCGPLFGSLIVSDRHLGWRWLEWIAAIITFGLAALLVISVPETQYTGRNRREHQPRSAIDNYRFWPASGGGNPKVHSFVAGLTALIPYFGHPIVLLAMVFFSIVLMTTTYALTTQSYTFLLVYGFAPRVAGATNIAPLLATCLGIFLTGILMDYLAVRETRRTGKAPKPEHRLLFLAVTGPIGVGGLILFGACTQNKCHWIGPVIGSFMVFFSFISSASCIFAYLLDVYEARMDAVMVVFNGIKNIATFGISYAIVPWNTNAGFTIPFVVLGMLLLAAHLVTLFLYFAGARLRQWQTEKLVSGRPTHHGDAF